VESASTPSRSNSSARQVISGMYHNNKNLPAVFLVRASASQVIGYFSSMIARSHGLRVTFCDEATAACDPGRLAHVEQYLFLFQEGAVTHAKA
jgi:hypothetical protein